MPPSRPPGPGPDPDRGDATAAVGCQNCREQHLKCDRASPTCGRCASAGRACTRGYKFRVKNGPFSARQNWVKPPERLTFVIESGLESPEIDASPTTPRREHSFHAGHDEYATGPRDSHADHYTVPAEISPSAVRPHREHFRDDGRGLSHVQLRNEQDPPLVFQDRKEAKLFRHFVQKLAIWLDLCDAAQSFETVVPGRAATCTILLNAILALSAKHLNHVEDFDPYASDRYHKVCLDALIPMLSHEATASDENLFAATIILRVWEEMEVKHSGIDAHSYLLGIHAFVHGGSRYLQPGSLSAASFWVGLRQEIYSAVMNQQPVRINLVHSLVDRSLGQADDYEWANRAIVHCADVLNYCFGNSERQPPRWWTELDSWNKQWHSLRPSSFTPIFFTERGEDDAFPEIWYQSSCHVIGVQHHLLAELFLVSFDPKLPRIGSHRKDAARQIDHRVQGIVRRICGIGLCNQWTPPSMFTACMAIAAFGDRFPERSDQEAFLDMLKRTERDHARPTERVQAEMIKSWDWATS